MTTATAFRAATDAFAFDNSWPVDGLELHEIRHYLAHEHSGLVRVLANSRLAHLLVRKVHAHHLLDDLLSDEHVTRYGLCGGMAFAALDYYTWGWVVPQGAGPADHPAPDGAAGRALRNYIWQRLLDSMQSRAFGTMFRWSIALHVVPNLGARWVLAQTKKEWRDLKQRLDGGAPWPIGLVGRAHGSIANHQVLATGYDDAGDGTGTINVYDSCCPRSIHTIALDFRGRSLIADESCAQGGGDTQWKGFFCDAYTPARPPIAIGVDGGIVVRRVQGSDERQAVLLTYTARNYSFSRCPPVALRVVSRRAAGRGQFGDAGGEDEPQPLEAGASRTLVHALPYGGAETNAEHFSAYCFLGVIDGAQVWKRLPMQDQTDTAPIAGLPIGQRATSRAPAKNG